MSSPNKSSTKPKLSKDILEDDNVFFYDGVEEISGWLRPIQTQMRQVRTRLPHDLEVRFKVGLDKFRHLGQDAEEALEDNWSLSPPKGDEGYRTSEFFGEDKSLAEVKKELDDCQRVSNLATKMRETKMLEPSWTLFLQSEFFKQYDKVHSDPEKHEEIFKRWELHEDVSWSEFNRGEGKSTRTKTRTGPKPDLTYAFPIFRSKSQIPKGYRRDTQVQSFMLSTLNKLRNRRPNNVISSPRKSLQRWTPRKREALGAVDLMCFPWAIVEVKTSPCKNRAEQFCYCQAANASAEALTMRESLAAQVENPSREALVIFSFTCIGPSVRLWVTYRDSPTKEVQMRCIWATSLELVWGVFALRMVLENMRAWVYQRVKPEIAKWISVARKCSSPRILSTDGDSIEQERGAISLALRQARPFSGSLPPLSLSKATPTLSRGKTTPKRIAARPSINDSDEDQTNDGYSSDEKRDSEDSEEIEAEYNTSDTESLGKMEARVPHFKRHSQAAHRSRDESTDAFESRSYIAQLGRDYRPHPRFY